MLTFLQYHFIYFSLLLLDGTLSTYFVKRNSQLIISAKTFISMVKLKSSAKAQTKIKKFNYVNPLLSAINNSKNSNSYQFQAAKQKIFSLFNAQLYSPYLFLKEQEYFIQYSYNRITH